MASLAEHRAARGDEVTVVCGRGSYFGGTSGSEGPEVPGLRVRRLWTPAFGKKSEWHRALDYLSFLVAASGACAASAPQDVVVTLTTPPYLLAAALAHKARHRRGRAVLWIMDCFPEALEGDGWIEEGGLASRALRAVNRRLYGRLDHVVCLDGAMRDNVQSRYAPRGMPEVTVIPNWERVALFPRSRLPEGWFERPALGDDGTLEVLYLGNAGHNHPFDAVVTAARALQAEPVRFRFVGGGTRYGWLSQRVADLRLGNVLLEPYVPKERTPEILARASCSLITLRESLRGVVSPSKLHSSLAMGLPVLYVGPGGSNVDEAVRRFGCGESLREGDSEGIVRFVRSLLAESSRLVAMRRRARQAFEEAYCDTATLPAFDAVIDGGPPATPGAAGILHP